MVVGGRGLGAILLCAALTTCGEAAGPASAAAPNIVLIVADDLGFGDLDLHGGPDRTPELLALAREGVRLTQFHAFPLCTPSRAALLTGRSPLRDGLAWSPLRPWAEEGLEPGVATLPGVLRAAGYRTALLGKWHLGHARASQHPLQHGFDHFYGFLTGAVDYFTRQSRDGGLDWQRNGASVEEPGYVTRLLTEEAERLIAGHDFAQPLFLMLSYSAPHRPMQAPQETLDALSAIADPIARLYAAMLVELDQGVGRVRRALQAAGQTERTLVLFVSDNGAALNLGGSNGELKGGKSVVLEGGLRVPAVLCWPGELAAGTELDAFTSVLDLAPSLAGLAGEPWAEVDGRDLHRSWWGEAPAAVEPVSFVAHNESRGQMALVDWPWKLVRRLERGEGEAREQLFHLLDDPTEENNRIREEEARAARMRAILGAQLAWDPSQLTLDQLPPWDGETPSNWQAPADWAGALR